jgi:Ala-tRNA(Pro) deacylase
MSRERIEKDFYRVLEENSKDYSTYEHEPVLDFVKAAEIAKRFGLTGKESKSLFIKGKSGTYYIYLTTEDKKMESKKVKELLGEKVNIVPADEMVKILGCEPGCIPPFGYNSDLIDTVIVDEELFDFERFVCSPGAPEVTLEIETKYLKALLKNSYDRVLFISV